MTGRRGHQFGVLFGDWRVTSRGISLPPENRKVPNVKTILILIVVVLVVLFLLGKFRPGKRL